MESQSHPGENTRALVIDGGAITRDRAGAMTETNRLGFQVKQRDAMTRRDKIAFAALMTTYAVSVVSYGIWWFNPQHIPRNWNSLGSLGLAMDVIYFLLLSAVIWRGIIQNWVTFWVVSGMKVPVYEPPQPGLKVAMLTAFVPGKEPYDGLERTLAAMTRVSYPHDTWVLDEGDDPVVKSICQRLGVKHFSRKSIPEYNQPSGKFKARTKAGNHNAWADTHSDEYDIVAQMDMDFVPKPNFFERTLGYFRDPQVAFVGSPQIYGNQSESWIARGAAEQAFIFYGAMQKGLYAKGMQLLVGANHVIRTKAWRDIDGYAGHIVEDHLTGMKVYAKGWKSVYVPEILCVGEGPTDMASYLVQQTRWAYGCLDILFRYTPKFFWSWKRWTLRLTYPFLQVWYVFGVAQLLGAALTTAYLAFGLTATSMDFVSWVTHSAPPFLIGLVLFQWLQKFSIDPKTENGWPMRGFALMFAAWPVYALAFVYALAGRKLTYAVTPKGSASQTAENRPALQGFTPHLASAGISLLGIAASPFTGFRAPQLLFWAVFNFVAMSGVLFATFKPQLSPGRVGSLSVGRRLSTAAVTAVAAMVVFSTINLRGLDDISPNIDLSCTITSCYAETMVPSMENTAPLSTNPVAAGSTADAEPTGDRSIGTTSPDTSAEIAASSAPVKIVQAQFLKPGQGQAAIGSLATASGMQSVSKISHSFATWNPIDIQPMVRDILVAAQGNQISMISWEPRLFTQPDMSPTRPDTSMLRRIAAGEFDSYIAQVADNIKATQQPVMLRFAHEMDLPDDGLHPWATADPSLYVAAYRRIHDIFQQQEASNVIWVWSPGGRFDNGRFLSLQWYPGERYVDVVGLSVFIYWQWEEWDQNRMASHAFRSPNEAITPAYNEMKKLGKPVILAEVGVDLYPTLQSQRKAWLLSMLDMVKKEQFSQIVGVVFYNAHHPLSNFDVDWTLSPEEQQSMINAINADQHFETPSGRWD